MTREELIQKCVDNEKEIKRLKEKKESILKEIALTYEHKLGEIVKWTETGRLKNAGSWAHPQLVRLPDVEHIAVLTKIEPLIWLFESKVSFSWRTEFRPIKKDGGISANRVVVNNDKIEWTGDIHKNYQNKE